MSKMRAREVRKLTIVGTDENKQLTKNLKPSSVKNEISIMIGLAVCGGQFPISMVGSQEMIFMCCQDFCTFSSLIVWGTHCGSHGDRKIARDSSI